jgi:uncharacterized integral membrane protein
VPAGRPYGSVAVEEVAMVQQSSSPPGTSGTGNGARGARLSGGLIATLAGGGLLLVLLLQNRQEVTLHFLFWSFTWPLWLFALVDALLGAIVWFGLGVLRRHRRRVARRAARGE